MFHGDVTLQEQIKVWTLDWADEANIDKIDRRGYPIRVE